MKNFLEALYKTMYSFAVDIIVIMALVIFYSLAWNTSKVFAIVMFVVFGMQVYMEYKDRKEDK